VGIELLTCNHHGSSNRPSGATDSYEIDVHRVHDALEIEGYLYIEYLTAPISTSESEELLAQDKSPLRQSGGQQTIPLEI